MSTLPRPQSQRSQPTLLSPCCHSHFKLIGNPESKGLWGDVYGQQGEQSCVWAAFLWVRIGTNSVSDSALLILHLLQWLMPGALLLISMKGKKCSCFSPDFSLLLTDATLVSFLIHPPLHPAHHITPEHVMLYVITPYLQLPQEAHMMKSVGLQFANVVHAQITMGEERQKLWSVIIGGLHRISLSPPDSLCAAPVLERGKRCPFGRHLRPSMARRNSLLALPGNMSA